MGIDLRQRLEALRAEDQLDTGRETVLMQGIPAMTNDIVNLVATLSGAALATASGWAA